jgi:hypothetical protein
MRKTKNLLSLIPLTTDQYMQTMSPEMIDVTDSVSAMVDIWPYVELLAEEGIVPEYVYENALIELVFRNQSDTFDHVLLPTDNDQVFVVIIVDLILKIVKGHLLLDLNKEYGME